MKLDPNNRVADLAIEFPSLIPALEELGIDYACRGNRTLLEACDSAGVDAEVWIGTLGRIGRAEVRGGRIPIRKWNKEPLSAVINFIIGEHHTLEHREIVHLLARLGRATKSHGAQHPAVARVEYLFRRLAETLQIHILQEERDLFLRIEQMEAAVDVSRDNPIRYERSLTDRVLIEFLEHDVVAERLRRMRELTHDYRLPSSAPKALRQLWHDLREFDRMLQRHIHLENNILYPRAMAMESGARLADEVFA